MVILPPRLEYPPRSRRPHLPSSPLARAVVVLALTTVVIYLVVPAERARPFRAVALALLLAVLFRTREVAGRPERPSSALPPVAEPLSPPTEQRVRLARLEAGLVYAVDSRRQFERAVVPLFQRLAREQLLMHHGIDVETQPAVARRILGEGLWQLFEARPAALDGPGPPPAELQALVGALGEIRGR